jgi:hypothetical protein
MDMLLRKNKVETVKIKLANSFTSKCRIKKVRCDNILKETELGMQNNC